MDGVVWFGVSPVERGEKVNSTGAGSSPPFPAMRPAQNRIAPATPRIITGGTGSGSVRAHQNASPIALAATDANTRGQLTVSPSPRVHEPRLRAIRRRHRGG